MDVAFLTTDFKLPDYSNELLTAAQAIEKLKDEIETINLNKTITDKSHEIIFERIIKVLDYVGKLSQPSFEIEYKLEELYIINYPHSPELAKKLWQDHYENIHHPFDLLKNRCFRLIEELDAIFHIIHKRHPRNWKP
jgi:hypothetical protein